VANTTVARSRLNFLRTSAKLERFVVVFEEEMHWHG
jgi:hypothetical protein